MYVCRYICMYVGIYVFKYVGMFVCRYLRCLFTRNFEKRFRSKSLIRLAFISPLNLPKQNFTRRVHMCECRSDSARERERGYVGILVCARVPRYVCELREREWLPEEVC